MDQVGQEETGIFKKQCRRGTSEETEAAGAEPPGESMSQRALWEVRPQALFSCVSQPFTHHGKH